MKLFLIGNGFDIAHDIHSKYSDFGVFLEKTHPEFYRWLNSAFNHSSGLWSSFEECLPDCGIEIENSGLQMGQELASEIDYDSFDDRGLSYWLNEQYNFVAELPKVFREWVNNVEKEAVTKSCVYRKSFIGPEDILLSFNYTSTIEKLYGVQPHNILHIHGKAANFSDDLILGHGDKYQVDSAKKTLENDSDIPWVKTTYDAVINYIESTRKNTSQIIANNQTFFNRLNDSISEIHVIGVSFGTVDLPYFAEINKRLSDVQWVVYYYEDKENKEKTEKEKKKFLSQLDKVGVTYCRVKLYPTDELK